MRGLWVLGLGVAERGARAIAARGNLPWKPIETVDRWIVWICRERIILRRVLQLQALAMLLVLVAVGCAALQVRTVSSPNARADLPAVHIQAEEDGVPIGSCRVAAVCIGENGYADSAASARPLVSAVYVEPTYRRRGVAAALMGSAEDTAREWGFDELGLQVHERNRAALGLYGRLGYEAEGNEEAPSWSEWSLFWTDGSWRPELGRMLRLSKPLSSARSGEGRPPLRSAARPRHPSPTALETDAALLTVGMVCAAYFSGYATEGYEPHAL